ncbi:MAG: hypothetical protein U5L96_04595 [Owenweeksia sp.]|nr:hypothetical protein [Owenweeksia sp.]
MRPARDHTMEKDGMRSFDRLASRVLDFRFYDQMLLILGNSGREMRLINQRGVLKDRFLTPTKMLGIARDCLGGLHAYSRDSAYSIYYDYEELHFLNPLAINEFEELVLPCRCYFQGGLIYTISKKRDLITSVQYANKSIVATIKEIKDSSALQFLDENYGREYFTGRGRSADMSKGFFRSTQR